MINTEDKNIKMEKNWLDEIETGIRDADAGNLRPLNEVFEEIFND